MRIAIVIKLSMLLQDVPKLSQTENEREGKQSLSPIMIASSGALYG
jgi:hypothetical protein